MANANIGVCPCPTCGGQAFVRKQSKGAELLYLACNDCGHISPRLPKGQDYILNRAVMYGPGGPPPEPPAAAPPAPPDEPPPPTPATVESPPAKPARRPIFATLLDEMYESRRN